MTGIHFGFEVGSGTAVSVPLMHTVITGQTQSAGKTTALDGLLNRSGRKSVVFLTKRGEGAFADAPRIQPYFAEKADWAYVAAILEASRGEKLKFERAWIIRASKGARTLADVHRNVRKAMETAKGLSADVYLTLDAYLEVVVPQIEHLRWASVIALAPGVNVMDLTQIGPEMQHLVIRSTIEWVLAHETKTTVVLPEAWKYIPQGRGTPVKLAAEAFIRQAAGLGNYLLLDSQDIAGVEKIILKSVTIWILGVQRESNEIKRTLDQIPASIKKPKPADIATLSLGQFYVCHDSTVKKVYAQPRWMDSWAAAEIAKGTFEGAIPVAPDRSAAWLQKAITDFPGAPAPTVAEEADVKASEAKALKEENARLAGELRGALEQLKIYERQSAERFVESPSPGRKGPESMEALARVVGDNLVQLEDVTRQSPTAGAYRNGSEDALYQRFRDRLAQEAPKLLKVAMTRSEIEVEVTRETLTVDGKSLRGRIAQLLARGFFAEPKTQGAARTELKKTGSDPNSGQVSTIFADFVKDGFLRDESEGYVAVPGMKARIVESR